MLTLCKEIKATEGDISSGTGTKRIHLERGVDAQAVIQQLTSGSATSAQITLAELYINGKRKQSRTGAQIDAYNVRHKRTALASLNNTLFIPLALFGSLDPATVENSGVPYDGEVVTSAWLDITFAGASSPVAEYRLLGDPMRPSRVGGDMLSVYRTTATLTNGTKRILDNLPYGQGEKAHEKLMRLLLVDGSGAVTDLEVELDGVKIQKRNNYVNACIKDALNQVTVGTYFCPVDFDAMESGFPGGIILKDYKTNDGKLVFNALGSADETLPALVEFLGPAGA